MKRLRRLVPVVLMVLATLLVVIAWQWPKFAQIQATGADRPFAHAAKPETQPAYVNNTVCISCHAEQAGQWSTSHHAQAMALATPISVRGAFDGRQFKHAGVTSRFFKRGDQYFVNTDGPNGKLADFEVRYTFGVEPLQQYLIAMAGGRFQALQIAWDDTKKQWYHLRPTEKTPPGDVLHWTGRYQTTNTMCIVCHTTAYERRYDAASDSFDSTWKESNVSCQACHGPGEAHVTWAKTSQTEKPKSTSSSTMGLTVQPHSGDPRVFQEICTPCHSRRSELTATGVPGQPLMDHFLPSVLRDGLYHADGQQSTEEVFVDGSFRQSKMFKLGVTCTNCHNPHTGKLRQPGNALCLQCHASQPNAAFPSAAGSYDSPGHHFHAADSPAAQCVNCHMPSKVYMGIQSRPDHSLRVPRPDLSAKTGAPNACNSCHTKESSDWAAGKVAQWYGAKLQQGAHFGEAFAGFRAGKAKAADALVAVIADVAASPIVRATALDALRGDSLTGLPMRINALSDPSADVRVAAADSLATLEPRRRMEVLGPRLTDPLRAVRMAAVHSLSTIPRQQLAVEWLAAFDAAVKEYIAVQSLGLDMPGARLNLAVMYENTGQIALAEQSYRGALALDPDFSPARLNLAQMLAVLGRIADAQTVLKEGLARVPAIGEMQYALGLLLAQDGKTQAAIEPLQKAVKLLPQRARVHYNLGLAYQQTGQTKAAEQALLAAARVDESDPDALYALAAFYFHGQQLKQASFWVGKLRQLQPGAPRVLNLERALGASAGLTAHP
ncbi:MAG: tetratricopeptide repeat protein [Burkholderiales bacterium]